MNSLPYCCALMISFVAGAWPVAGQAGEAGPLAGAREAASEIEIDARAIAAAWQTIDILKKDELPEIEQWDQLFATPAYAALVREEIPRPKFEELFEVAFMPSKAELLGEWRASERPGLPISEHLIEADRRREEIENYLSSGPFSDGDLQREALALMAPYVSPEQLSNKIRVPVSLAIFMKDARGYPDTIIFDALFAIEAQDNLKYWLAHEMHHFYQHAASPQDSEQAQDPLIAARDWVLNQLQGEGIADMIDKPAIFYGDGYMAQSKFATIYAQMVDQSPAIIDRLNGLLAKEPAGLDARAALAHELRAALPMAGHPTGYFMAKLIEQELGREQLVATMGDSEAFVRLYNEAAKNSSIRPPRFLPGETSGGESTH